MKGNLQFRRGFKWNLPSEAPNGMPLWCSDTQELYMGTGYGVVKIGTPEMKDLDCESIITLETNTIYRVTVFDDVEFKPFRFQDPNFDDFGSIPSHTQQALNHNIFNQILVQLYMPDVVSIDLGTEVFFNGKMPTLSNPGFYDIIYEFDNVIDEWVCGVIYKGYPEE